MHSIFDLFQLIASNVWLYGGAFILVLSILVFVHEWGHYIVAVKNGVKVDSFSIGFGKELFGFTDKRGTRWKFSLVPLGGYVKMFGDIDPASSQYSEEIKDENTEEVRPLTKEELDVAFFNKSVGVRSAVVFAGPAINFIFAIILLAGLYMFYGQPVTPPIAGAIIGDTPAEEYQFKPHDVILEIEGEKVRRFEDLRREVMIALDTPLTFKVEREGQVLEIIATPEKEEEEDRFGFKHSYGFLGIISMGNALEISKITSIDGQEFEDVDEVRQEIISKLGQAFKITLDRGTEEDIFIIHPLAEMNPGINDPAHPDFDLLYIASQDSEVFIKHTPFSALTEAVHETYVITTSTLQALGQMFTGTRSATELGGLIRIGAIAGDMAKHGFIALVTFTALLSINLGLINLFPIPMLDGGHLVFYFLEAVRGAPISEQIQEYAFRVGLALLVGLMVFANLNDIVQILM